MVAPPFHFPAGLPTTSSQPVVVILQLLFLTRGRVSFSASSIKEELNVLWRSILPKKRPDRRKKIELLRAEYDKKAKNYHLLSPVSLIK